MKYEFTFLLPCLNEEKTLPFCLEEIHNAIAKYHLNAEILVSDNNSTDQSREIAKKYGARVVIAKQKGYGSSLRNGIQHANGKYCIMGDSDGSYDFSHLEGFINALENGYDLVVGNRFLGGIELHAMPFSHKIGVKLLSIFANLFFHTPICDYHCGLRAFVTEKINTIALEQNGMEFASEMIIKAKLNGLSMVQVPTILRKDLRDRKPHLRTIRDGCRHLALILEIAFHKKKYIR